jgi:hypothetical protein
MTRIASFLPTPLRVLVVTALMATVITLVGVPSVSFVDRYVVDTEALAFHPAAAAAQEVSTTTSSTSTTTSTSTSSTTPSTTVLEPAEAGHAADFGHEAAEHAEDAARVETAPIETDDFDLIGVRVEQAPVDDEPVLVRFRANGDWSEWQELGINLDEGPDPGSAEAAGEDGITSEPLWVGDADAYQLNGPARVVDGDAEVLLVRERGTRIVVDADVTEAGAITPNAPSMTTRGGWGARAPKNSIAVAGTLNIAVAHHTVTSNTYSAAEVPGIIRGIQTYHMDGRGWSDIGYNFVVDRFGRIFEGRHNSALKLSIGAHAGGFNTGSVGVASLGNHETAVPGSGTLDAMAELMAWKFANHNVNPWTNVNVTSGGSTRFPAGQVVNLPRVIGHRQVSSTACPGGHLYARMTTLRGLVTQKWPGKSSPLGGLTRISGGMRQLFFEGYAIDPNTDAAVDVHIYVDGVGYNMGPADEYRAYVPALFPNSAGNHGFTKVISGLSPGRHDVCVYAINSGVGDNAAIHCSSPTVMSGWPGGTVDVIRAGPNGGLYVSGWAIDWDTTAQPEIHVWVDGFGFNTGVTADSRPDINARFPLYPGPRGYSWSTIGLPAGAHNVCVYAINRAGGGGNTQLRCQNVAVPSGDPFGVVAVARGLPDRQIQLVGWSLDPDTSASTEIHAYVDGKGYNLGLADDLRPDLAAVFPGYGPAHGYSSVIGGVGPGGHNVCVYAINRLGPGNHRLLSCHDVTVPSGSPIGAIDVIRGVRDGRVQVIGWALDPDTAAPAEIHVYVDGVGYNVGLADSNRPDVGAFFVGFGPAHGMSEQIWGQAAGQHNVCVYAINRAGAGGNTLLGCRDMVI